MKTFGAFLLALAVAAPGWGQARTGAQVYEAACAACHGHDGRGGRTVSRNCTPDD